MARESGETHYIGTRNRRGSVVRGRAEKGFDLADACTTASPMSMGEAMGARSWLRGFLASGRGGRRRCQTEEAMVSIVQTRCARHAAGTELRSAEELLTQARSRNAAVTHTLAPSCCGNSIGPQGGLPGSRERKERVARIEVPGLPIWGHWRSLQPIPPRYNSMIERGVGLWLLAESKC